MKTQKTGGKYDYTRRAFSSIDDMAYFLGRSPSYVQARLTGGVAFTDRETDLLNRAVKFYDRTDIYPVTFQKMQKRNGDECTRFVYSIVWTMATAGAGLTDSVKAGHDLAQTVFDKVPEVGALIETLYELTDY